MYQYVIAEDGRQTDVKPEKGYLVRTYIWLALAVPLYIRRKLRGAVDGLPMYVKCRGVLPMHGNLDSAPLGRGVARWWTLRRA